MTSELQISDAALGTLAAVSGILLAIISMLAIAALKVQVAAKENLLEWKAVEQQALEMQIQAKELYIQALESQRNLHTGIIQGLQEEIGRLTRARVGEETQGGEQ